MGLFRKRSSSSTTSTKLKRPSRNSTLPPEVPAIPPIPASVPVDVSPSGFRGPTTNFSRRESQNPIVGSAAPPPTGQNVGTDGFSTPISQVSGLTHPSDVAMARSTAPSSVDAMSAVSSFRKNGVPGNGPQVQLNGQRISTSTNPEEGYFQINPRNSISGGSIAGSEFDSRPSSMTITALNGPAMNTANRKPPPPPLRDNPSTSTLPQEWTDRDPSINTRFTHSPTPSESASMQSSVVYPQQPQPQPQPPPQPERKPQNRPQSSFRPPVPPLQNPNGPRFRGGPPPPGSHRPSNHSNHHSNNRGPPQQRLLPPPTTPRSSSYRQQNMLPSLPENRRAMSLTGPRPISQIRPNIPPTPGPKHLAVKFTSNHIECNNKHKTLVSMRNYHHPVPCLTCRRVYTEGMQYCSFCALRICNECADRLKKEWNGDITRGWGGVTSAAAEFSASGGSDAKMVAGWGDHAPPLPAKNAVNQLVWPTKSNTERVCTLLGVPYRPKTAPASHGTFVNPDVGTPDFMEQPQFSFESNLDIESGASTISPPSPVTPPAFASTPSEPRLPLGIPNEHRLPISISSGKPNHFDNSGYGYPTHSPQIVSDSTPELVQARQYHHTEPLPMLTTEKHRSHTFSNANNQIYRSETQQSNTTVNKAPVRPVTGTSTGRSGIIDTLKSGGEKKKGKGLMGLFSKK